jgi:hypothetical protein
MSDQSQHDYDPGPQDDEDVRDDRGAIIVGVITSNHLFEDKDATIGKVLTLNQGEVIWLGEIGGRVDQAELRPSKDPKYTDSVWLGGIFEAVRGASGEVIRAPWLILPGGYGPMILNALKKADTSATVKLDVELGVTRAKPGSAILHRYIVRERVPVDPRGDSALAEIRADREARALRARPKTKPRALPGA